MPKCSKTLCFTRVREHTPVGTKAFGTYFSRVSRSGAPVAARPQPPNTTENWPQSGRDLGLVVGPPEPPQRVPGEAQEPPRERKTPRIAWIFEKPLKTSCLKMCTPLECQAHFGQKGPQTERQSRRTAVFFVVALKVARRSPKGRRSAPARFWKALTEIGRLFQKYHQKQTCNKHAFLRVKRPSNQKWWPSGQKWGPSFFKKRCASRAPGAFGKPVRAGTGSTS